jgi:hypothetical protein
MFRLNMELVLHSLFGLLCTAVLTGRDPTAPPLPPLLGSYTRELLVSQDRRHLFVTPVGPCFGLGERVPVVINHRLVAVQGRDTSVRDTHS